MPSNKTYRIVGAALQRAADSRSAASAQLRLAPVPREGAIRSGRVLRHLDPTVPASGPRGPGPRAAVALATADLAAAVVARRLADRAASAAVRTYGPPRRPMPGPSPGTVWPGSTGPGRAARWTGRGGPWPGRREPGQARDGLAQALANVAKAERALARAHRSWPRPAPVGRRRGLRGLADRLRAGGHGRVGGPGPRPRPRPRPRSRPRRPAAGPTCGRWPRRPSRRPSRWPSRRPSRGRTAADPDPGGAARAVPAGAGLLDEQATGWYEAQPDDEGLIDVVEPRLARPAGRPEYPVLDEDRVGWDPPGPVEGWTDNPARGDDQANGLELVQS
jgi:hypothetical protein